MTRDSDNQAGGYPEGMDQDPLVHAPQGRIVPGAAVSRSAGHALDFTDGSFDAAHKGEYAEQVHGHTWFVRVFWPAEPPKDARFVHARLRQYLEAAFDHRMLDDVCSPTNLGVARTIAQLMGDDIKKIVVWREGSVPCGTELVL